MAAITITITDQTAGGSITNKLDISFANELTTVKQIVIARVYAEVENYNRNMPNLYKGLVQPGDAEATLNGYAMKAKRKVDPEKQSYIALEAFNRNAYFMLIDNIQAESLEQMVVINAATAISFIKLTPLVGG